MSSVAGATSIEDVANAQDGLDEVKERVAIPLVADADAQLSFDILDRKGIQGIGDNLLACALGQALLVQIIRQVHVGVALICEQPGAVFLAQHHDQVIAIVEVEWGENPVTRPSCRFEKDLVAYLAAKICLDVRDCHGSITPLQLPPKRPIQHRWQQRIQLDLRLSLQALDGVHFGLQVIQVGND